MKKIKIKLSHSEVIGNVVREDALQWILSDVTVKGIKETRTFEGYSVPKSMTRYHEMI